MVHMPSDRLSKVLAFSKQKGCDKALVVFNFSGKGRQRHSAGAGPTRLSGMSPVRPASSPTVNR
jgi:hypothetical protein